MNVPARNLVLPLLAGVLFLVSSPAFAQSGSFVISQNGHPVGSASFTFNPGADGINSASLVNVSMQGLSYSLSKTEALSPDHRFRRAQLSATVNGSAVTLNAATEGTLIVLDISANGRKSTNRLALHRSVVFLPDFDPGALETLLTLAAANNNRDLWAIIPKETGSVQAIQLATHADEHGTLDGKPVAVHHLVATIAGAVTDIFSDQRNQFLQAELPQPGFAMVRKGFVLAPSTSPGAPPAKPATQTSQPSTP
jgi:hypothetical protein